MLRYRLLLCVFSFISAHVAIAADQLKVSLSLIQTGAYSEYERASKDNYEYVEVINHQPRDTRIFFGTEEHSGENVINDVPGKDIQGHSRLSLQFDSTGIWLNIDRLCIYGRNEIEFKKKLAIEFMSGTVEDFLGGKEVRLRLKKDEVAKMYEENLQNLIKELTSKTEYLEPLLEHLGYQHLGVGNPVFSYSETSILIVSLSSIRYHVADFSLELAIPCVRIKMLDTTHVVVDEREERLD